jgi:endonuclease-3 related protein
MVSTKVYSLYRELYEKHGNPIELWPQWCAKKKSEKLRELIAVGAILTQRTSWRNADIALRNLNRENLLSLKNIASLPNLSDLAGLVRPAGFIQTKPKRLFSFASFVVNNFGSLSKLIKNDLSTIREKLLNVYGIGPETADAILLYALDKPSFVIDEYTKRLVIKRKLSRQNDYDDLKHFFEANLPKDVVIYQNYHVLIIVEQKGRKDSIMEII